VSRGRLQPFRPWPYDLDDEPKEDSFLNGSRHCGVEGRNTCAVAAFPWVIAPWRSRLTIETTKATAANSRRVGIRLSLTLTSHDGPGPPAR
jgi:hypothetical protein